MHPIQRVVIAALAALVLPLQAGAQSADVLDDGRHWWFGLGLGSGSVDSLAPAPSSGRDGVAAGMELGYRLNPNWGLGLEWGTLAPLGGCAEWQCGESSDDFAPSFGRTFLFGEYRPVNSGWRFRAGMGMSRFCYQRHWDDDAWSVWDTLMFIIDDDYLYHVDGGSGAYRCDASRRALGGSVSVGYDWRLGEDAPVLLGARLSAEAANFPSRNGVGPPSFRHRAVMLTLQLVVN
jgi:hypothetical protein